MGENVALARSGNAWNDFWANFNRQGGFLGNVLNEGPALTATGYYHDTLLNIWVEKGISFNLLTNYGTMLPAALITYASLLDTPWGAALFYAERERRQ